MYHFFYFRKKKKMESDQIIKLYNRRWLVLINASLLMAVVKYYVLSFGPINNIIVAYFHATFVEVDWIVLSTYVAGVVLLAVIAYFSFKEMIDLRFVLLISAFSFLINSIGIAVAFVNYKFFPILILGQIFGGILNSTSTFLMAVVGTVWFPENQIGIVTGVGYMAWNIGALLDETLPENVFKYPTTVKNGSIHWLNDTFNIKTNWSNDFNQNWYVFDKKTAQIISTVTACLAFSVLLTVWMFIPSYPKHPPSKSQAVKLDYLKNKPSASIIDFFSETKSLLDDLVFILIQIVMSLTVQTFVLESVLIVQIIDPIHDRLNTELTSNMVGGYIIACRSIGDMIGSFLGGKILDMFRRYRLQIIIGTFGTALFVVMFTISWYNASLIGLFVAIFMMGVISYISVVALYDSVVQHTYPKNIIFVSSWAAFIRFFVTIIITSLGRLVYQRTDAFGVLIFHCCLQVLGFILSLFVNPNLKRQEEEQNETATESTLLISERSN